MITPEQLTARIVVLGREIPVTELQKSRWEYLRSLVRSRQPFDRIAKSSSAVTWLTCNGTCCRGTGRSFLEALAWIEYAASFIGELEIIPLHEHNNPTGRKIAYENVSLVWATVFNFGFGLGQTLDGRLIEQIGGLPSIRLTMKETPLAYAAKYMKVAEPSPAPYFFVWNPADRAPRKQHTTMADAEAEAERLAGKHQGQEFHVLEFKGKVSVKPSRAVWERVKR